MLFMKNKSVIIVSLVFAVMLVACGNKAAESAEAEVTSVASEEVLNEAVKETEETAARQRNMCRHPYIQ